MKRIAVIDYGSGNLRSVAKAFEKVAENMLAHIALAREARDLEHATHIVLPGVGTFGDCMRGLNAIHGLRDAMEKAVLEKKTPFLGICVGMQLLVERGYENGTHEGLGWIGGECVRLNSSLRGASRSNPDSPNKNWIATSATPPRNDEISLESSHNSKDTQRLNANLKIPHMGWNELQINVPVHPLLTGIKTAQHAYFVHSYHVVVEKEGTVIASADYGGPVAAVLAKGNVMGTQFHPEKSQETGLQLLKNFLAM